MDDQEYLNLSTQTGNQMDRISKAGAKLERSIQRTAQAGGNTMLVNVAIAAARKIGGSPGDGAIEIYRDLDMNIQVADDFLSEWNSYSGDSIGN